MTTPLNKEKTLANVQLFWHSPHTCDLA